MEALNEKELQQDDQEQLSKFDRRLNVFAETTEEIVEEGDQISLDKKFEETLEGDERRIDVAVKYGENLQGRARQPDPGPARQLRRARAHVRRIQRLQRHGKNV